MTKIYILERNGVPFYVGKTKHVIRRKHLHRRTYGLDINLYVIDEVEDGESRNVIEEDNIW
jgi:hypothetical protein